MEGQCKEYQSTDSHKDVKSKIREQNNMQNMETYSQEIVQGNKKVQITLEFPYTVDPRDADRFAKRSLFKQNSKRVFTKEFTSGIIPNPKREKEE